MEYDFDIWKLKLIDRLYKLKNSQIEQKLIEKSSYEQEVYKIDEEKSSIENRINTATVDRLGSISDFMILAMHKDNLRFQAQQLLIKKSSLLKKIEDLFTEIVELQKQSEQYKYILEEEKEQKKQETLRNEMLEAEEFIQSKYIRR